MKLKKKNHLIYLNKKCYFKLKKNLKKFKKKLIICNKIKKYQMISLNLLKMK